MEDAEIVGFVRKVDELQKKMPPQLTFDDYIFFPLFTPRIVPRHPPFDVASKTAAISSSSPSPFSRRTTNLPRHDFEVHDG
jgi:hypothetical protein